MIFHDGETGDKLADKILRALMESELSRTQISSKVFQNDLTKQTIDAALDDLRRQGLARLTHKITQGKSAEMWSAV